MRIWTISKWPKTAISTTSRRSRTAISTTSRRSRTAIYHGSAKLLWTANRPISTSSTATTEHPICANAHSFARSLDGIQPSTSSSQKAAIGRRPLHKHGHEQQQKHKHEHEHHHEHAREHEDEHEHESQHQHGQKQYVLCTVFHFS